MKVFLGGTYLLSIVIIACNSAAIGEKDPCTTTTLFKLSLFNERDANGKWKADVHLNRGTDETSPDDRNFHLDVKQVVGKCNCTKEVYSVEANIIAPPSRPGKEYTLYPDLGYYRFHSSHHTWGHANHICNSERSHLAVIDSQEEANKVKQMLPDNTNAFVGFTKNSTGQFLTLYGNTQPLFEGNDASSDNSTDFCGTINKQGTLQVSSCNITLPFVCEQEL